MFGFLQIGAKSKKVKRCGKQTNTLFLLCDNNGRNILQGKYHTGSVTFFKWPFTVFHFKFFAVPLYKELGRKEKL